MDFDLPDEKQDSVTIDGSDMAISCECGGAMSPDRPPADDLDLSEAGVKSGTDLECNRCGRLYSVDFQQIRGMTEQYPVCLQCNSVIEEKAPQYSCYSCGYRISQPNDEEAYRQYLLEYALSYYLGNELPVRGETIRYGNSIWPVRIDSLPDEEREPIRDAIDFEAAETLPPSEEWKQQQFVRLAKAGLLSREVHPDVYEDHARDEDDPVVELLDE